MPLYTATVPAAPPASASRMKSRERSRVMLVTRGAEYFADADFFYAAVYGVDG